MIRTASAAPLLVVHLVQRSQCYGFRGMIHFRTIFRTHTHARKHITHKLFCSERVFILSILGLMKRHADIIHALSWTMLWCLLVCVVAWLGWMGTKQIQCLAQGYNTTRSVWNCWPFNSKSNTLPTEPLRSYKVTLVSYLMTELEKERGKQHTGVYLL